MSDQSNETGDQADRNTQHTEPADQSGQAEKTFTQDQVNGLLADQKRKVEGRYSDYGDLKAKAGELDKVRQASKSEMEKAVDAARTEGASAAMQSANSRLVKAEARALAAAGQFRDPADAVAFLADLSSINVSPDGDVDADRLKTALAELAKAKPYLLVEEKPKRPTGDAGQGVRGNDNRPPSMNDLIHTLGRR